MIKLFKIYILPVFLLFLICGKVYSENKVPLRIFTDRDYYISGDTIWFKVVSQNSNDGNVVHVQLMSATNNIINEEVQRSNLNWAEGYLPVPDSLSSGTYLLTAFLNTQRNKTEIELETKLIFVYNRFAQNLYKLSLPTIKASPGLVQNNSGIKIISNKNVYKTREKVKVKINFPANNNLNNVVYRASLIDPLASEKGGFYLVDYKSSFSEIPTIAENDGFIFSGSVRNKNGKKQAGVLVLLSIPREPPYFDYFVTGENGDFHFFLKNQHGIANAILQALASGDENLEITAKINTVETNSQSAFSDNILTVEQSSFISNSINANYLNKIFNPFISFRDPEFSMPERFPMPFYGPVTKHVVPDEFIDLPDFREISRELLHGIQYRVRDDQIVFRMVNQERGYIFASEPLRLINGIPVFKNSLLANLKSTDIKFIDLVQSERIFGDLLFKGVMSVSLYDKSNSWLSGQPNYRQVKINGLQIQKEPGYLTKRETVPNKPDIRQSFIWQLERAGTEKELEFMLSDLKGKVEIVVEGVSANGRFKSSKIIEVK